MATKTDTTSDDRRNETEARLELHRRWAEAGYPVDLEQLVKDMGYVTDEAEEAQVQPDVVITGYALVTG